MTALQEGFSDREDAKDTKIFKNEVQDLKSFASRFDFSSYIINFLRALRAFAVKVCFFSRLTDYH